MAIELLQRVKDDQKRRAAMEKELEKVGWNWPKRFEIEKKYRPILTKTQMNDSMKMARRLIGESYI